jgi:hypothetical protein
VGYLVAGKPPNIFQQGMVVAGVLGGHQRQLFQQNAPQIVDGDARANVKAAFDSFYFF